MANSPSDIIENLNEILDKGEVSSLCTDCCPCNNTYVFGSVETALLFFEATGWIEFSKFCNNSNVGYSWYTNCCTDTCLEKLSNYLGEYASTILDKGIFEYSLLGGKSMTCILYDWFVENEVSPEDAGAMLSGILDKGVVFYCNKDNTLNNGNQSNQILASVETYINWAEALNIYCQGDIPNCETCLPSEICCLNLTASAETYNSWSIAVGLITQ